MTCHRAGAAGTYVCNIQDTYYTRILQGYYMVLHISLRLSVLILVMLNKYLTVVVVPLR